MVTSSPTFTGPNSQDGVTYLTQDPITWALAQLSDLHSLATNAAAADLAEVSGELQPQVDGLRDEIRVALEKSAAVSPN